MSYILGPSCNQWEFQYNSMCYWIEDDKVTWDKAVNSCSTHQGIIAQVTTNAEVVFLRQVAGQVDNTFWIDGKTSFLQGNESEPQI